MPIDLRRISHETFGGLAALVGSLGLANGCLREDLTRVVGQTGYYGNVGVDSLYDPLTYKTLLFGSLAVLAYNTFVRRDGGQNEQQARREG